MQSPFLDYIRNGWVLVPLSPGDKHPKQRGWNEKALCLSTESDVEGVVAAGLAHAFSGTCCIDIDDVEASREYLKKFNLDLDSYLDDPNAVKILSGRPNRAKLLYQLPANPLPSAKIIQKIDGVKTNIIDFRCATRNGLSVQDALPPTIHPNTKKPYYWEYNDLVTDWRTPPTLPPDLLSFWMAQVHDTDNQKEAVENPYGPDELRPLLGAFDPDTDYNAWINVGMALHHATDGNDSGLDVWDEWSEKGEKYNGRQELETHWRSFRGSGITVDYLLMHQVADPGVFEPVSDELDGNAAEGEEKRRRFVPEAIDDWVKRPPPEWLIHNFLPQSDMAMIFGDPGSGKSFLALDIAMAIAGESDWWGKETRHGPVLWIAAEAAGSVRNRALAYAKAKNVSLSKHDLWIVGDTPDLNKLDDVRELAKGAREVKPRVIVVDTMVAAAGGANENSGEDMAIIFAACRVLHRLTGALVLLIHHTGKDKARGARGWSGIKGAMQTMIEVSHSEETGERCANIHKQRDGEEGVDYLFRLAPVNLLNFEGVPQTSCVVEPLDSVSVFRPVPHCGWYPMAMSVFLQAGADSMPLEDFEEQLQGMALSSGVETDLVEDTLRELLKQLAGSGLINVDGSEISLLSGGFEDLL